MSEPQTFTVQHLRALLEADSDAATLALLEGRIEVVQADQLETPEYRGALTVISRDELQGRVGDHPDDDELVRQATALTAATQQLGG